MKIFRKIHLWLSVPFGVIITLICFSGAMLVFEPEITRGLKGDIYYVTSAEGVPIDMKELMENMLEVAGNSPHLCDLKARIATLEERQRKLRQRRNGLYADYKEGILTEKDYAFARDQYQTEIERVDSELQSARQELSDGRRMPEITTCWIKPLIRYKDTGELTREMCQALVEKVILNENSVSIHFTFADEYEKALGFLNANTEKNGGVL